MIDNIFYMHTINAYFDFDDLQNPVKTYLHDIDVAPLTPGVSQNIYIDVNQNKAELNDGWFLNTDSKEIEFYTNQYRSSFATGLDQYDGYVLIAKFTLDGKMNIYERTAFNLLELFGLLGGVYEIIELVLRLLLSSLSQKIFLNSLIANLYHVRTIKELKINTSRSNYTSSKILPIQNNFQKSSGAMIEENK